MTLIEFRVNARLRKRVVDFTMYSALHPPQLRNLSLIQVRFLLNFSGYVRKVQSFQ
jgi:hypothetical protein